MTEDRVKQKELDDARWWDLITDKKFQSVLDYFQKRKTILDTENLQLSESEDTVNSLQKIGNNLARIREINAFLAKVNFKRNELSKGRKK